MPNTEADRLVASRLRSLACALILFGAVGPARAVAQVRASERASVSQTVDGTIVTIEYSRPLARGRTLFGGVVKWGERWTPGANWATTFETSRAIELNGHAVSKGKYTVWMIPQQQGEWTVFLSDKDRVFHTQRQRPEDARVRFTVQPEEGPHMEALAWYFPTVSRDGATLRMHWGTLFIPLTVTVEAALQDGDATFDLAPMLGSYALRFEGNGEPPMTSASMCSRNAMAACVRASIRRHPIVTRSSSWCLPPIAASRPSTTRTECLSRPTRRRASCSCWKLAV